MLVPDAEKQVSKKEDGVVNFIFESNIHPAEFLKTNIFDLAYISARNERFETHSNEDSMSYFESLNHEISDVIRQHRPRASRYLLAKFSYYLTHCMARDVNDGSDPKNVIRRYFNGTLDRTQYAKLMSVLQRPIYRTVSVPVVSTIEGIKGQGQIDYPEGDNCLFILAQDLAPYLFERRPLK